MTNVNIVTEIAKWHNGRYSAGMGTGDVGYNIKRLREEKLGWTQTQLADATGLDASSISKYESGAREPSGDATFAIARALGVPMERLFRSREQEPSAIDDHYITRAELHQEMQRMLRQEAARLKVEIFGTTSNENLSGLLLLSDKVVDNLPSREGELPTPLFGHESAEVFDLRASADAFRFLLHDEAEERPIEVAMFRSRQRRSQSSRVVGFAVVGNCLAPIIRDGATIFVEVDRLGFPLTDLTTAVDSVVFAAVGDALHAKVLRQRHGHQYVLADLNGGEPIPITEDVRIIGVVIDQLADVRVPPEQ